MKKQRIDDFSHPGTPEVMFRVSMLPGGVSPYSAQPDMLKTLVVSAQHSLGARSDESVAQFVACGYHIVECVPASQPSALERDINARAQQAARDPRDCPPPDLRGPNYEAHELQQFRSRTVPASLPPALPTFRRG